MSYYSTIRFVHRLDLRILYSKQLKNLGKKSILGADIIGMYGLDGLEHDDEDIYG